MPPSALFLFFSMFFFAIPVRSEESCTTGECSIVNSAGLSLIQSRTAGVKVHAIDSYAEVEHESGECKKCKRQPKDKCCSVRGKQPNGNLDLDIFTPAANQANAGTGSAVVLVFHGRGGSLEDKDMHGVCREWVVPAGFVCVTVDKLGEEYLEGAIRYLTEHADAYGVDPDNFFAYGYSKGGYGPLAFMLGESDVKNKLKGVVSDSSAPGGDRADFQKKDSNGNYLRIPPYFMIHCDVDKTMKPKKYVDKSEKKLKAANDLRGEHEKIRWQSMRFSKATRCGHHQLVMNCEVAANAMLSFIRSVLAGIDPFTNIPKKVTEKDVAKKK